MGGLRAGRCADRSGAVRAALRRRAGGRLPRRGRHARRGGCGRAAGRRPTSCPARTGARSKPCGGTRPIPPLPLAPWAWIAGRRGRPPRPARRAHWVASPGASCSPAGRTRRSHSASGTVLDAGAPGGPHRRGAVRGRRTIGVHERHGVRPGMLAADAGRGHKPRNGPPPRPAGRAGPARRRRAAPPRRDSTKARAEGWAPRGAIAPAGCRCPPQAGSRTAGRPRRPLPVAAESKPTWAASDSLEPRVRGSFLGKALRSRSTTAPEEERPPIVDQNGGACPVWAP